MVGRVPSPFGQYHVIADAVTADLLTSMQSASTNDTRAARYIHLLRAVYRLSNSSASLPVLSTHLLRTLFINLGIRFGINFRFRFCFIENEVKL